MGFLTELIPTEPEITHHTTGLPGGPATVALAIGGTVAGKLLQLEMDFQLFHGILCRNKGSLQRLALGPELLCQLATLHVTGNHRLLCHQKTAAGTTAA